jgi:YidC/Oxa1 family membrane protein insertase
MNDIRRTILWVVFAFSIVLLWDQWQVHNGRPATFFPQSTQKATATAPQSPASTVPASVPPAAATPAAVSAVPGAAPAAPATGAAPAPVATPRERITLTSDVLKLVFDSEGGALVRAELLKHADAANPKQGFALLDQNPDRVYVAQTGLVGGSFPTHLTPMAVAPGERTLRDGQNELSVRFESAEIGGVKLVKTYTLKRGAYDIAVRHEVLNTGSAPVSPQLYLQLVRDGNKPGDESPFYSTFTGPAAFTGLKKFQKVEFSDIEKNKADFEKTSPDGYVAMVQHYFASAWLLPDGVKRELFMRKVSNNLYSAGLLTTLEPVAAGATRAVDARLFVGPQEEHRLEAVYPGLELVKDYGWLTILAKPLYWLLEKLHSFIGNWGWAIVALVLLLKIAFYWLNAKAYSSMAKMKAINPRIMEMRERLKDKPAADAAGDDAHLPRGKGQPHGRVLPDHGPDPGVHRAVLGAAVQRGDAQRALGAVDPRPVHARPVFHPAARDDGHHAAADRTEPGAAGSAAGQADVVHAADLQRDVLLLPVGPGAVLDHEQHAVDCPAVGDQHAHGCAAAVQPAQVLTPRSACGASPRGATPAARQAGSAVTGQSRMPRDPSLPS